MITESELRELLIKAVHTIEGLAGQQAMTDDWYEQHLAELRAAIPRTGAIYTVVFFRDTETDDPTPHGDLSPVDQFSAELQEAMEETGLPAAFFKVVDRRWADWSEWDQIKHQGGGQ